MIKELRSLTHLLIRNSVRLPANRRGATVLSFGVTFMTDPPVSEVVAVAKRDLKAGERLDGVGGFCTYGLIDKATEARAIAALPIGLSEGAVLRRDIAKDTALTFADVNRPPARRVDRLWQEQAAMWPVAAKKRDESSIHHVFEGKSR